MKKATRKTYSDPFSISPEFINESKLLQTGPKKRGGPYTTKDMSARRNEVYKLHFDYGYSARKIADVTKINRKTINNDLKFLYSEVYRKWGYPDPTVWLLRNMENLEVQKIRVRMEIDKATEGSQKISFERLLLDIETRRIDLELKICNSLQTLHTQSTHIANKWLEKHNRDTRFVTYWDTWNVSKKGYEKIKEIKKYEKPF